MPSTAADWIEFDNNPELLRLVFMAGLQPIAEAAQAVVSAQLQPGRVLRDGKIRGALEVRLHQAPAAIWRTGENGLWIAASTESVLCAEGRLQHISA